MKKFSPPPPPNITNIPKDKIIGKQRKKFSPPPPPNFKNNPKNRHIIVAFITIVISIILFILFKNVVEFARFRHTYFLFKWLLIPIVYFGVKGVFFKKN